MRLLLVHPGARWSVSDVYDGLHDGLVAQGVEVVPYRLDTRVDRSRSWLHASWRAAHRTDPTVAKPTMREAFRHASMGLLEQALLHEVDAVVVVSGILLHQDAVVLLRRAGVRVFVLFTESPYDSEQELALAARVDGCWTNERTAVPAFKAVNPHSWYLPHAWHPTHHTTEAPAPGPAHDVVFVGTGWGPRVQWLNAINWDGIDLGLYGLWKGMGLEPWLEKRVMGGILPNAEAVGLYKRSKIALNMYRRFRGTPPPESLNPRAYELAACGVFAITEKRAESGDVFGALVPQVETAKEAETAIRDWLARDDGRRMVASRLPSLVADASWTHRAAQVADQIDGTPSRQAKSVSVSTHSEAVYLDRELPPARRLVRGRIDSWIAPSAGVATHAEAV